MDDFKAWPMERLLGRAPSEEELQEKFILELVSFSSMENRFKHQVIYLMAIMLVKVKDSLGFGYLSFVCYLQR